MMNNVTLTTLLKMKKRKFQKEASSLYQIRTISFFDVLYIDKLNFENFNLRSNRTVVKSAAFWMRAPTHLIFYFATLAAQSMAQKSVTGSSKTSVRV